MLLIVAYSMQIPRWAPSGRRKAGIGLFIAMITVITSLPIAAYAGHMGWVEEDNELRASYPDKTWWLVGATGSGSPHTS